jgi:hypothetical protein
MASHAGRGGRDRTAATHIADDETKRAVNLERGLNQILSVSTTLTIAIGVEHARAAKAVMRSNAPSGGESTMS